MTGIELLRRHLGELTKATGIAGAVTEADGRLYVVLETVPLPAGLFQVSQTSVMFMTDPQYPMSAMDMFWVDLGVVRPDGSIPQNAESIESYLGRDWRRFSWHRQGAWKITGNPLLDHFALMEARWTVEPPIEQEAA